MTTQIASPKTFIETFDQGPCGWIGWEGAVGPTPVEIRDGVAVSRSPWWVDFNHAPPGAGYLHILFALHLHHGPGFHPAIIQAGGPNAFVKGGYSTNLTNAKITVRIKGEMNLRGAQMVLLVQGNIPTPERPLNWTNQVLFTQPVPITPEWSDQTIQLVPDQKQWVNLGSHQSRADRYGKADISDLLKDVNGDIIFVLFPLDVAPLKPFQGNPDHARAGDDYEIDRSRLPEGQVMLDEVRIEFP